MTMACNTRDIMMTEETEFIMPPPGVMLQRLLEVDDSEYLLQHVYLPLLENANKPQTPMRVAVLVEFLICLCIEDMPEALVASMERKIPAFVDALIPNPMAALEARLIFEKSGQMQ